MVKYSEKTKQLDLVFGSLADPIRRQMLRQLARRPMTVSEIAGPHNVSLPAISKHLRVLERARLVRCTKRGRRRLIFLDAQALKTAEQHVAFYRKFWEGKLDALRDYLEGGDSDGNT